MAITQSRINFFNSIEKGVSTLRVQNPIWFSVINELLYEGERIRLYRISSRKAFIEWWILESVYSDKIKLDRLVRYLIEKEELNGIRKNNGNKQAIKAE